MKLFGVTSNSNNTTVNWKGTDNTKTVISGSGKGGDTITLSGNGIGLSKGCSLEVYDNQGKKK